MAIARCWKAVWFYAVLHKGLRFSMDDPQIHFAETFGGENTGWTLGAMAHEVNYYPYAESASVVALAESSVTTNFVESFLTSSMKTPKACLLALSCTLVLGLLLGLAVGTRLNSFWLPRSRADYRLILE